MCSLSHDVASSNMISSHFLDVHVPYLASKKGDDSSELFIAKIVCSCLT